MNFVFELQRIVGYAMFVEVVEREKFIRVYVYLSVVDLTSSRFHSPQVNCRAVDRNSNKLVNKRNPTGPMKYGSISCLPAKIMTKKILDERIN